MSRFNAFKNSTQNENKRNSFKQNNFKHNNFKQNEKKNSRWDSLKSNENSFSKDSNNFPKRNNFKRRRNKRIYKSLISKEELDKKMALRGSRQMGISLDDMIKKKPMKNNKIMEKPKPEVKTNIKSEPEKGFENEKMSDDMKYLILNQFYEEDEEEEEEEEEEKYVNQIEETKKDDGFIGFN